MANSIDPNSSIRMVIVAEKSDCRLTPLVAALDGAGVAPILCRDVYSAIREILNNSGHFLVAGALAELCRQDRRFVEICALRGIPCIGWLPPRPTLSVVCGLDAAVRAGVQIAGDTDTLIRILERHLRQPWNSQLKPGISVGGLRRDEALLTEQELAALFGDT